MSDLGIRDLFVIGGDATEISGPYSSALELLPAIDARCARSGSG